MVDVVADLETVSVLPNAGILSIGAVKFDPQRLDTPESFTADLTFYRNILPAETDNYGLHTDPDTLRWWSQQAPEARAALQHDQIPLDRALREFHHWLVTVEPRANRFWAKDPDFDSVILRSAYRATNLGDLPIPFWLTRSVRTIQDLAYPNGHDRPEIRVGTHHNALDDCISEALMIQHCHKVLGLHSSEPA